MTVTISSRFNGPPGSANGGYVSGTTARLLADTRTIDGPVEVTLRRPTPLGQPLRVEREDSGVALYAGDSLVTQARPAKLHLDLPAPVSLDQAQRAAKLFDAEDYRSQHPFPGCFTCGPGRQEGDGLRIYPAPTDDDRQMVAWPWTPDRSLAGDNGLVDLPVVWAALDCPSGMARFAKGPTFEQPSDTAIVLGRLTAMVHRPPSPGDLVVVSGWSISEQERKQLSGSALWSASGEVLAEAQAVWIVLDEEQQAAFNAANRT